MSIEELIKELDKNLTVISSKKIDNTVYIKCESKIEESECPYCGALSNSVHSKYTRTIIDLPIQSNSVKLIVITRKFFCNNSKCNHKTFGEKFDFVSPKAVRTKRLDDYINKMGLRDNSMDTVRNLKDSGINVSSNTVLRIIKKNESRNKL